MQFLEIHRVFLKKEENSQINNLTCHLNEFEKEEQTKPKVSRTQKITMIREEIKTKKKKKKKKKKNRYTLAGGRYL